MKKHKLKYNLLVMDDNEKILKDLQLLAEDLMFPFEFIYACDLDEVKKLLPDIFRSVNGVILDVRDAQGNTSSPLAARDYIKDFMRDKNRDIPPIVAFTAWAGEYESKTKDWAQTMEVFKKQDDSEDMFKYLIKEIEQSSRTKTRKKYSDIFAIVEKHMGEDAIDELYKCLEQFTSSELPIIKGTLTNIRSLQEKVLIALHKFDEKILPAKFIYGDRSGLNVNYSKAMHHLRGCYDTNTQQNSGDIYIPFQSTIDRLMEFIYRTCSEGIHAIDENASIKPTKYIAQSATFALMDLILWMGSVATTTK